MEEKDLTTPSEHSRDLTKREFLRKAIVGGVVMFVAVGGYVRPELETLQGPQVAHATGSASPTPRSKPKGQKRNSKKNSKKNSPGNNPSGLGQTLVKIAKMMTHK